MFLLFFGHSNTQPPSPKLFSPLPGRRMVAESIQAEELPSSDLAQRCFFLVIFFFGLYGICFFFVCLYGIFFQFLCFFKSVLIISEFCQLLVILWFGFTTRRPFFWLASLWIFRGFAIKMVDPNLYRRAFHCKNPFFHAFFGHVMWVFCSSNV